MTTQQVDAAPTPESAAVRQALRAADVLALERAAVRAVAWPLRARLVTVQRAAVRAWIAAFGSLEAPGDPMRAAAVTARIIGDLAGIGASATAPLDAYVQRAVALGVAQAAHATGAAMTAEGIGAVPDAATARTVAGLDQAIRSRIAAAEAAVTRASGSGFAELDTALGHAHKAVAAAARDTVTAVNGGANAGQAAAADFLGADRLCFAEPDCCTTCAGLAGRVAAPGQPFDARFASTFTDKPHLWPPGPLEHPPWHPSCRCRAETYLGVEPAASGPSLPLALQREARRAILKGWSLPSESQPERIRAARKTLARNAAAPASVKAYSRRAVAAGRFPTRDVPRYAPRPGAAKTKH